MSTVDDIMRQNRLATQTQPDDKDKNNGAAGQNSQQTQQTQQPVAGQTRQQSATQQTQQQTAVVSGATQNAASTDQASARVNYSTRELVPVQNVAPQGKSQEEARVNYATPVAYQNNSEEDSETTPTTSSEWDTPGYGMVRLLTPDSQSGNNNSSDNLAIQQANAERKNQMARLVDYLNKQYPEEHETEEEKKKRIKRERAAAIMAAIGDGISAISNIAFAKRGAQSTFKAENGMLPKWQKAYDERVAKRNADAKERMEALAKMYTLSKDDLDAEIKIDSNEKDEARKDAELKRKIRATEAQSLRWKAAAEKDEAMKKFYNLKADYIEKGYESDQAERLARIEVLKSQTNKNNAQAEKARSGGSRSGGGSKSGGGKSSTGYTQTTTREYTDSYGQPHKTTTTTVRTPAGNNGKGRFKNFHLTK